MNKTYQILFFLLTVFVSFNSYCNPIVRIENNTYKSKVNISSKIEYKLTKSKAYDPQGFVLNPKNSLNIGYTNKTIWLRLTFKNNTKSPIEKYVHFTSGLFLFDDIYEVIDDKLVKLIPRYTRTYKLFNALELNLNPDEVRTYVFTNKTIHRTDTEIFMADRSIFIHKEFTHIILNTIYAGIILALLIYNFILFFIMKDREYLIYASFLFFMGSTVLTLTGFLQNIVFSKVAADYLGLYSTSSAMFSYLFAHSLLEFKKINHRLAKYLLRFFLTFGIINIIFVFAPNDWSIRPYVGYPIDVNILLTCITVLVLSIYLNIKMPSPESKVYLLSWIILYISAFAYFASIYGLISFNFYTQHSILFGNIIETFTLSVALGLKINRMKSENEINLLKTQDQQKYIRLLRVLSHDIANSLFVISGYASRFLRRGRVDEEKAWPKVHNACEHIKNILDNVKTEQALLNKSPKLETFTIDKLITGVTDIFLPQCKTKSIELRLDIQERSLELKSNLTILTHQIIGNILSNAVKFTPNNGRITVHTERIKDHLQIVIADSGIGITKEKLLQIKQKVDTGISYGTMGEKGSGFGYFIIRSYSTLLNIDFNIDSSPDGTTVTLSIPLLN